MSQRRHLAAKAVNGVDDALVGNRVIDGLLGALQVPRLQPSIEATCREVPPRQSCADASCCQGGWVASQPRPR